MPLTTLLMWFTVQYSVMVILQLNIMKIVIMLFWWIFNGKYFRDMPWNFSSAPGRLTFLLLDWVHSFERGSSSGGAIRKIRFLERFNCFQLLFVFIAYMLFWELVSPFFIFLFFFLNNSPPFKNYENCF